MRSSQLTMGNDEFILYIRKNFQSCRLPNDVLGRKIWEWLEKLPSAEARQVESDKECIWGSHGNFVSETRLPKTATQFEFNYCVLPEIYRYLSVLGGSNDAA